MIIADGSSTVYPITEAVAEEFQKANPRRQRHGRHLRHRRRLQEVLRRRDGHLRRLPAHQADRGRALRRRTGSSTSSCPIAYDGLAVVVNPKNDLGRLHHRRRAQEDLGARGAGQGHEAGARCARLAGQGDPALRPGRRLGHLRLLHRGDRREGARQPRRLHRQRGRQRARPGHRARPLRARLLRLRLLRGEQGQAEARSASTTGRTRTARAASSRASRPSRRASTSRSPGRCSST